MQNKNKIFWGIILVLAAVGMLVGRLFDVPISMFKLIVTVLLIIIVCKSIITFSFEGILFPLAILCIMYSDELMLDAITPWPVLIAAAIGTIGLYMISNACSSKTDDFDSQNHNYSDTDYVDADYVNADDSNQSQTQDANSNNQTNGQSDSQSQANSNAQANTNNNQNSTKGVYSINRSWGTSRVNFDPKDLRRLNILCRFGSTRIFLNNAEIPTNEAEIVINAAFSEVEIFVPKNWRIVQNANVFLAEVKENNQFSSVYNKTVYLKGNVNFAEVKIVTV